MVRKRDRSAVIESKIESFAAGAESTVLVEQQISKAVFKRTTFSLTDDLNKKIDELVLKPRTFRTSRSELVKTAVMFLSDRSDDEIITILETYRV